MNFELCVDVGEVDEDERIRTGLTNDPLHDPVDDEDNIIMTNCPLKLSWLTSVFRQLSTDERVMTQKTYG